MSFKSQYEKGKKLLIQDKNITYYNRNLFKEFFSWEEQKLKRQNGLPELDESSYKTLCAYINKLRNVNAWFKNKPWDEITETDINSVYNDLEDGKIKNRFGKRFEDRRSYYNKVFKAKPFKLAGIHEKAQNTLEFFTDKRKKEVRFISIDKFKRLLSFLQKPQHFVLFWLAWDIGENIASLLELKVKHFKKQINQETKEAEYLVYLPQETLKRSRQTRSEPTIYPETTKYIDALIEYGREIEVRDKLGKIRRTTAPYKQEDFLFTFKYRQALHIFNSIVKRSSITCEPNGEKPSWKDLRSGMACYLFTKGWHIEDINLRLGHSPQSKWINSYINYLALNRKKVIKNHFNHSLEALQNELIEVREREKLLSLRLDRQNKEISEFRQEISDLKSGKGILSLLLSLGKNKQKMVSVIENLSGDKFDIALPDNRAMNLK